MQSTRPVRQRLSRAAPSAGSGALFASSAAVGADVIADQQVEGAAVDLAGHRHVPLALEAAHRGHGLVAVAVGHVAGEPRDLSQPRLHHAYGVRLVARLEQRRARPG